MSGGIRREGSEGGGSGRDRAEVAGVTVARAPNDMLVIERVFKCLADT